MTLHSSPSCGVPQGSIIAYFQSTWVRFFGNTASISTNMPMMLKYVPLYKSCYDGDWSCILACLSDWMYWTWQKFIQQDYSKLEMLLFGFQNQDEYQKPHNTFLSSRLDFLYSGNDFDGPLICPVMPSSDQHVSFFNTSSNSL